MQKLTLIDGVFSGSEMKEVVLTMISNKINFHILKKLRSLDKEGFEDEISTKRLEELHAIKAQILQQNFSEDLLFSVKSTIEIELIKK